MAYKEMNRIIGRVQEQRILSTMMEDEEPRMVAVYGRRRVGKTYLVRRFFDDCFDFYFTGSFDTPQKVQLALFASMLKQYSGKEIPELTNWFDAFAQLQQYLMSVNKKQIIVFLDELPWMDTQKSNFLAAFSFFWNSWASTRLGLKLIVCGSATTWMIDKIIGDKGGLYGRCSRTIYLAPFCLGEVEEYLIHHKRVGWNRYQLLEAYMIMGGIPYYLDMIDGQLPFRQNIDRLFFEAGAPLRTEYDFLFRSLFRSSAIYQQVVETIAQKESGMTLKELKESLKLKDSGNISTVLDNLCKCDFLRRYNSFGKKERGMVYQLIDQFSLFHLKFIQKHGAMDPHYWSNQKGSAHSAWTGKAFEQVCLHHVEQIRSKLGISGVLTSASTWHMSRQVDKDGVEWPGAQIDLVLSRADHLIDLCEMKYYESDYMVTEEYERKLRERMATFVHFTRTRDAVRNVLITTYGLRPGRHAGIFHAVVTMDDLFRI